MKKDVAFRSVAVQPDKYEVSRPSLLASIKSSLSGSVVMARLSRFYSRLLEMDITPLQAFHLTHAQLAFYLMLFPVDMGAPIRLLLLVWFGVTLMQCRRNGLK